MYCTDDVYYLGMAVFARYTRIIFHVPRPSSRSTDNATIVNAGKRQTLDRNFYRDPQFALPNDPDLTDIIRFLSIQ